jgi:hypothetical protein
LALKAVILKPPKKSGYSFKASALACFHDLELAKVKFWYIKNAHCMQWRLSRAAIKTRLSSTKDSGILR